MARDQRKVLWIVLLINMAMFGVESASGFYADSVALLGDSLDMLGDALAYGASLYVIGRSTAAKIRSAQLKAVIILISSLMVVGMASYRFIYQEIPENEIMGIVGGMALAANLVCLVLLTKFRKTDVNMASVWICSRNDIIANVSVLGAAWLVRVTGHPWPDLVVGSLLALLFIKSGFYILRLTRETGTGCQTAC